MEGASDSPPQMGARRQFLRVARHLVDAGRRHFMDEPIDVCVRRLRRAAADISPNRVGCNAFAIRLNIDNHADTTLFAHGRRFRSFELVAYELQPIKYTNVQLLDQEELTCVVLRRERK